MTCAVALQSTAPDTEIVLPTKVLTRSGVNIDARRVDADVRRMDRATSALAIRETRLDAVPPGEHPTRISPRNAAGSSEGLKSKVDPRANAVNGIIKYWQNTPIGIDDIEDEESESDGGEKIL
jgi:hypothetical protein